MIRKLGKFLVLLSIILIALFLASDVAGQTDYSVVLGGFVTLVLAILVLRKAREPREDKPRFRFIRGLRKRKAKEEEG
ncbi:MAG: hypothetical protein IH859_09410 [Chloroflexi bacterium]|nr:hypothetical protein [Chloroflexota bacterium]